MPSHTNTILLYYNEEVMRQLSDKNHYKELYMDMSLETAEMIRNIINKYVNGLIQPEVAPHIIPSTYREARFYVLPKVHKTLDNPPGRPIISANNNPT